MIAIKRVCKFFDRCQFADEKSRTCIEDAGGEHCGIYRTLSELQKVKENDNKERKRINPRRDK